MTASGAPCKRYAMSGSDRCPSHLSLSGPKTSLSPELTEQLTALLGAGNYLEVALRVVNVPKRTFRAWMERGKDEERPNPVYRDFRQRIERARAQGEARNVAAIARAAQESWQAAAWLLERQHPERWGRVSVRLRDEAPPAEPVGAPAVPDDPFAEVDELAERRALRPG